jgi:molybdopterin/thiamine biosynthesis adenylyltransferase
MSQKPIVRSPAIQRLIDEGYEIDIRHQHLLVHSVPYVTANREIDTGILVCTYLESNGMDSKPSDHTVWFRGNMPCTAEGQPLHALVNNSNAQTLFDQFVVQHYFSNKPVGVPDFPADYYVKMVHYIDILVAQARVIDPDADARTGRAIASSVENSIFRYPDSASARAGIVAVSQKLVMSRIGIVGVGGTGSYILDQVAKTPVKEIHLFDGADFKRHNAFRAPGAASLETLQRQLKKVDYFCEMFEPMRSGIVCHPYHLDGGNVVELAGFDFVFVSVDDGLSRELVCRYLQDAGIPFIDVGMGLEKAEGMTSLLGLCRVTVGTPAKQDHLATRLPIADDRADVLYRSNIQVADMNAMNAILAVIRWKQFCGFYVDLEQAHHLSFSVALQSIARAETIG